MWLHWPEVESLPCAGALRGEVTRYPWPRAEPSRRQQQEIVRARDLLIGVLRILGSIEQVYEWRHANGRISRLFIVLEWSAPRPPFLGIGFPDVILAWERAHGFFCLRPPCNPRAPVVRVMRNADVAQG